MGSLIRSPDYSIADILRTVRGISASQAALLPALADTDLVATMPRLDVPIVIVQGRLDQVAPGEATQRFHAALMAPSKELVWFEKSAHTPHFDEPGRFHDLLMNIRAGGLADNSPHPVRHDTATAVPRPDLGHARDQSPSKHGGRGRRCRSHDQQLDHAISAVAQPDNHSGEIPSP